MPQPYCTSDQYVSSPSWKFDSLGVYLDGLQEPDCHVALDSRIDLHLSKKENQRTFPRDDMQMGRQYHQSEIFHIITSNQW
jgi:hypothetical protein